MKVEIPSKVLILAMSHNTATRVARARGLQPRECIVAADSSRLEGLILREGDAVLVADALPVRLWETLQHRLVVAGLAIAGGGRLVAVR